MNSRKKNLVYLTVNDVKDTSAESLFYGYTFLFDPFILDACRTIPQMKNIRSFKKWNKTDLLIAPIPHQRQSKNDQKQLLQGAKIVLEHNGAAVLVQPSLMFYKHLPALKKNRCLRELVSLCELWRFNTSLCNYTQNFPHRATIQAVNPHGKILATVGEWPALIVNERMAFFTVDQLHAFARWRLKDNIPLHANLWVELAYQLLGLPVPDKTLVDAEIDLRRDFHAFGYALIMLRQLATLQKKNIASAERNACRQVLEASGLFVRQQYQASQKTLSAAFNTLYAARRTITKMNFHIVDSGHAATLHDDVGLAEMEWPQLRKEFMEYYLHLIEKRDLRVCLDWDAASMENMAQRFPKLMAVIRRHAASGKLEFINGGYVQQYPHYWSAQSAIQNFKYGRKAFLSVTGQAVKTYGGQECCMNPQMPNLLVKTGYRYALHRIQNFGHVPIVNDAAIAWRGKDGKTLPAIPGNPSATERLGNSFYIRLARKINQSLKDNVKDPVFTELQDMDHLAFREEVCRIAYYAPIFGKFTTISEYFKNNAKKHLPIKKFDFNDYLYGYFYRTHRWRGNENELFIKAFLLERAVNDGQFINSLATFRKTGCLKDWGTHWEKILQLQAHDALAAGNMFVGGFYGRLGIGGGPMDTAITNYTKAVEHYENILDDARKSANRDLRGLCGKGRNGNTLYLNTLGFARRATACNGHVLLPPCGYTTDVIHTPGHVKAEGDTLENKLISVCIDQYSGCIKYITDKSTGKKTVLNCNEFVYGNDSGMRLRELKIIHSTRNQATMRVKGEVYRKSETIACYETRITLADESRILDINTHLAPNIDIPPNPCDHAFRFKIQLPGTFDIIHNYINVKEKMHEGKICKQVEKFDPKMGFIFLKPSDPKTKMFSSPYYVRMASQGNTVDIFNDGAQFYYRKDNCVYQHLIGNNDHLRDFHYAISINDTRQPFIASLDWQTPVLMTTTNVRGKWSLFSSNRDNLLLFGVEYIGEKTFRLRIAELDGRRTRAVISCGHDIREVIETNYFGNQIRKLKSNKRNFTVQTPEWSISEYHVKFTANT